MLEKKFFPGESRPQEIKINIKRKSLKGVFQIHKFEDHGHSIVYLPSLNITAYGDNPNEASEMLDTVIEDFLDGLFTLSEAGIVQELVKLGWKRNPLFQKDFSNTVHVDKEGILRNFNLPAETKIQSQLMAV